MRVQRQAGEAVNKRWKHGGYSGGSEAPEHYIWRSMLVRCTNAANRSYRYYGGRGIKVCERWLQFENFLADMGRRPTQQHSLERIDNDRGYEPGNCVWDTRSAQQKNKTPTRYYFNGYLALTLVEVAALLGISKELANWRFRQWKTFEKGTIWHELPKPL